MIKVQNIPAFVLATIATRRLRAILVPLNPMFRPSELDTLMADAQRRVMVLQAGLFAELGPVADQHSVAVISASELDFVQEWPTDLFSGAERVELSGIRDVMDLIAAHDGERPPPIELTGDDIAFLVYTSGTTGPPKVAMNTHRGLVLNSENYRTWCGLTPDDVCSRWHRSSTSRASSRTSASHCCCRAAGARLPVPPGRHGAAHRAIPGHLGDGLDHHLHRDAQRATGLWLRAVVAGQAVERRPGRVAVDAASCAGAPWVSGVGKVLRG